MMKTFIKSVGKNSARDYITFKLYYNYMYKVKSGSAEEDEYISLLSSLKSKRYPLSLIKQNMINSDLKKIKKEREENKR